MQPVQHNCISAICMGLHTEGHKDVKPETLTDKPELWNFVLFVIYMLLSV